LVGGPNDQMISYYIAFYTAKGLNWGAATALSLILLALTGILYFILDRLFGLGRMQMMKT
jgi:putative spermidine/putrescine transport system permease protein